MLGALAEKINILRLAFRALLRHLLDRAAVMALETVAALVIRHRDTAIHALNARPTTPAQNRPRIPTPVDEHKRLRLARQAFLDSRVERRGNGAGLMRFLKVFA